MGLMSGDTKAPVPARGGIVKVHTIAYDSDAQANSEIDQHAKTVFAQAGIIEPPISPDYLVSRLENSNALRQNIDAYATNIDAHGFRLKPVMDLDADDADEKVADVIFMERMEAAEAETGMVPDDLAMPTDEEIQQRKEAIRAAMRIERVRLENWFDFVCQDHSFVSLRMMTRVDKELMGYGYWEAVRNKLGKIQELKYVQAHTVRLLPQGDWVEVTAKVKSSAVAYKAVQKKRRFRRYVQIREGKTIWFKEFGDTRLMSADTGGYFADEAEMVKKESAKARKATEILEFKVHTSRGAYGVPRWIGNMMSVQGSAAQEFSNLVHFENQTIPDMVVMVEGGTLAGEAKAEIESALKDRLKGKKKHTVIVLQALPAENAGADTDGGKVRIKIQPLAKEQQQDALFMEYDRVNRDKIGESFRLPKLLRGDVADVNRASAWASLEFAEKQVFGPERNEFDWMIDRKILPELDAKYHTFESRGPDLTDPEVTARVLRSLENIITPAEARRAAGAILGDELKEISEDWTKQPIALTLAQSGGDDLFGIGGGGQQADAAEKPDGKGQPPKDDNADGDPPKRARKKRVDLLSSAAKLITLRDALAAAEGGAAAANFRMSTGAAGETVVEVPAEIMEKWFERDAPADAGPG